MQSQTHLHMRDNGHGNLENGNSSSSSNTESSSPLTTKSSKPKSSMQVSMTSTSTGTSTASTQSSHKHSYDHGMTNDPNQNQHQSSKTNSPTSPGMNKNQFLLEQQIKLTQLHQLQQLQQHIFQQQMAIISGQPTAVSTVLPASTASELVNYMDVGGSVAAPIHRHGASEQKLGLQSHGGETQSGPHTFSGLPTPAPSGEIRPMDYNTASPMMNLIGSLNLQHIEPLPISMIPSSNPPIRYSNLSHPNSNIPQRYGHRHTSSLSLPSVNLQNNRQSHASYPSSPSTFDQVSPTFHPISPMHLPISHPYHRPSNSHHSTPRTMPVQSQMQAPWHSHSSSPSTPISAPPSERIEFSIFDGDTNRSGGSLHATPHLHSGNSVHTSPSILGSGVGSINGPNGGRGFGHGQQLLDLDQDISPLTSPWLGATVSGSGGTAVSTSVHLASNPTGALIQKVEASHARRTSISGNKRTASESGDEGDDAWSRGGTNGNSRKRPVLGNRRRTGSLSGPVGSNAAATPGLVGGEKEKGGEKDDGKNRGSTSPLTGNSTSSSSEFVSSPTTLARDSSAREGGGGHLNGGSSHTPVITSSGGSSISSRRTRKGSRSTSTTSTPLLRSTPSTTNLLSPSPFLGGTGRREGRSIRLGGGGQGQGQELNSPSPVDLNIEAGQGQDGKTGRSMPPPPLPRGGVDVDVNSTEPTSPMDDSSGHLRDGMLGMGGMGFDSMMSLDDGMGVGMVGMGMSGLGGMGMGVGGLDGMSGMDMESMGGIGGMGMEEMGVNMGMSVNMGGMGGFGNGHEDSHHQLEQQRREDLGMMGMGYGRDHDEEGTRISSSSSSARTNAGMSLATHRPQSHLLPHSEYQQEQPHLSPAQTHHSRPLSHQHSLHTPQMHGLQTEQSQHQLQDQLVQSITGNQSNQHQPVMPVATPSSILNLGRFGGGSGGRLGSASSASTSMGGANSALSGDGKGVVPRAKKATKAAKESGGSNGGGGSASRKRSLTASMIGPGTGVGLSPALKPLRPSAPSSESTLPSPVLTGSIGSSSSSSRATQSGISTETAGPTGGGSITATPILSPSDAIGVIRQPKRTHRDAEQRRRNSQKQVIDELRGLLPPIALPSDNANNNGDSDLMPPLGLPGTSPFFFQPTATLLPGGLPPRGPPKAGGEGPNKNVSKLQVLLCGNEYIKLLKARVERRDEEIEELRREVRRLRALRGRGGLVGEEMGREEGEVDLEKDLDAVERLQMMNGKGAGGESSVHGMGRGGSGNDAMDEDDDYGDD